MNDERRWWYDSKSKLVRNKNVYLRKLSCSAIRFLFCQNGELVERKFRGAASKANLSNGDINQSLTSSSATMHQFLSVRSVSDIVYVEIFQRIIANLAYFTKDAFTIKSLYVITKLRIQDSTFEKRIMEILVFKNVKKIYVRQKCKTNITRNIFMLHFCQTKIPVHEPFFS